MPKFTPEEFRERQRERCRKWAAKNPEKMAEYSKRYARKYPEARRESVRKHRLNNLEKVREANKKSVKKWRDNHPEKSRSYAAKYRQAHPGATSKEKQLEYSRRYEQKHPEKSRERSLRRRMRKLGIPGSHTTKEWDDLCRRFKNRCVCCGEARKLTKDHVVPVTHDGCTNFIENIQPLCQPCNSSKKNKCPLDYRATPFKRMGQAVLFS